MKHYQNEYVIRCALIVLLALLFSCVSIQQVYTHNSTQLDAESTTYIVELYGAPLASKQNTSSTEGMNRWLSLISLQHTLFLQDCIPILKSSFPIQYEYLHVFNGFSLDATIEEIQMIRQSPYVKTIYLAQEYYLQRETSVPTTKAPYFWDQQSIAGLHYRGQGMLIGIIDTGVDYNHGELGGGMGTTWDGKMYKVRTGFDFSEMNSIPYSIGTSNHGTHVAGIAAGNGETGLAIGKNKASGVAPDASLAIYKVFTSNKDSTRETAILMALEQSMIDKCDVVNLSLGKNFGWSTDPLSIACDRLVEAGVIVVASAGNSGPRNSTLNPFPIHAPGSGLSSISVAASDATPKDGFYVPSERGRYHFVIGQPISPTPKASLKAIPLEIVSGSITPSTFLELQGKAVMVFSSDLSIQSLYRYAEKSDIHSVLVVNTKKAPTSITLPSDFDKVPMMSLSFETGTYVQSMVDVQEKPVMIHYGYQNQAVTLASFSSQGPTPDFYLKPEITAPGYQISSTITNHQYGIYSGTSMSSPYVAGGVALLKQLHSNWSPSEIKSLLINYAKPIVNPLTQERYSIYLQGGGSLDLQNSFSGSLIVDPPTISYGSIQENESRWIRITNKGSQSQTLEFRCNSPIHQNAAVVISPYKFTIEPHETIPIKITLEVTDDTIQSFGEFWLEAIHDGDTIFQVPSIFYHGTYPAMDPILTSYMFPTLAISPNHDGYGDQNHYVCLSPYNIDGIEIDVFDQKDQFIQNLFYHRGILGAGYYAAPFTGIHNGKLLEDGYYKIKSYVLPTGKDYKIVTDWEFGKESSVLVDTVPPELQLTHTWLNNNEIHIVGQILDENASHGLFLYYELDYDDGAMLSVKEDGSFDQTIQIHEEHCFIRFTAQDIAGNRSSVKRRIPDLNITDG